MKLILTITALLCAAWAITGSAEEKTPVSTPVSAAPVRAFMDDEGPGWRALTEADFAKVNSSDETWSWKDGVLHCTGQPVSVMRTAQEVANFELVDRKSVV
jgi:hypothetical protein